MLESESVWRSEMIRGRKTLFERETLAVKAIDGMNYIPSFVNSRYLGISCSTPNALAAILKGFRKIVRLTNDYSFA